MAKNLRDFSTRFRKNKGTVKFPFLEKESKNFCFVNFSLEKIAYFKFLSVLGFSLRYVFLYRNVIMLQELP